MGTVNSGRPFTRALAVTNTAKTFYPPVKTKFLQLRNEGANAVEVFWDRSKTNDSTRGFTLAASGSAGDFFEGPVELFRGEDPQDANRGGITLKTATGTSTVRALYIQEGV